MKKKLLEIPQKLYTFDPNSLEGDISKLAEIADFKNYWKNTILKYYPNRVENIDDYHRFNLSYSGSYSEWDSSEYTITGYRWETLEEASNRMAINRKRSIAAKKAAITKKEKQLEEDRKKYEELKKKFE